MARPGSRWCEGQRLASVFVLTLGVFAFEFSSIGIGSQRLEHSAQRKAKVTGFAIIDRARVPGACEAAPDPLLSCQKCDWQDDGFSMARSHSRRQSLRQYPRHSAERTDQVTNSRDQAHVGVSAVTRIFALPRETPATCHGGIVGAPLKLCKNFGEYRTRLSLPYFLRNIPSLRTNGESTFTATALRGTMPIRTCSFARVNNEDWGFLRRR
jgi:hypothetical protein